jgi:hypothetical protein
VVITDVTIKKNALNVIPRLLKNKWKPRKWLRQSIQLPLRKLPWKCHLQLLVGRDEQSVLFTKEVNPWKKRNPER